MIVRLVWILVFTCLPTLVAAQGLGDHAARERQRRESVQKDQPSGSDYVYTDHDLKAYRPPGSEDDEGEDGEGGDDGDDGQVGGSAEEDERLEELRREQARLVRGRNDPNRAQRDEVSRAQAEVDKIERRMRELNGKLNPMSRDYIYGAANTGSAANEEIQIKQELSQLENDLQAARQELTNANADLANATGRSGYDPRDEE